jgi:aspartokinase
VEECRSKERKLVVVAGFVGLKTLQHYTVLPTD